MSRFRCGRCNKQMAETPVRCPHCGVKPPMRLRNRLVITAVASTCLFAVISILISALQAPAQFETENPKKPSAVNNEEALRLQPAGCVDFAFTGSLPPLSVLCAPMPASPLPTHLTTPQFSPVEIDSAANSTTDKRTP